ncbi:unnamed protein product [Brachionus calyciflorus]|uniref:DUF547 domain-containing protein n=1 Tax=Brachionus calyciflorus TaxID=104777 RepID=A0A814Q1V1_9BILA|nr:unnamed protein product [Brachionus calyciflorus]
MAYQIGPYKFSLDDIEHGILRSNRLHPTKNIQFFAPNDPRLKFKVKNFDPRIHFALNCGAKGCPPISFYTIENVERGLQAASINFCTNETEIDTNECKISLSRLFLWYGSDFVSDKNFYNEQILEFIGKNLRECDEKATQFKELMRTKMQVNIEYSNYDWEINNKI